jgi:hypothetical protein
MPVWLVTLLVFGTVAVIIMIAHLLSALVGLSHQLLDLGSIAVINVAVINICAELDLWSAG